MKRILGWVGLLAGGVAAVGLGVFFAVIRLDDADKWGSVVGALVALLGLPMTVYGLMLARRQPTGPPAGQAVADSVVGGGVTQVRGVRGNLRIGSTAPSPSPSPPPLSSSATGSAGDQRVSGTWTAGPVRQVDDVGGNADIDQ
jgi:hypothetical protein